MPSNEKTYPVLVELEYIEEEKRWNISARVKCDHSECDPETHEGHIMMYDCRYAGENEIMNSDPEALASVIGLVEDVEFPITIRSWQDRWSGEWDVEFDRADLARWSYD